MVSDKKTNERMVPRILSMFMLLVDLVYEVAKANKQMH